MDVVLQAGDQANVVGEEVLSILERDGQGSGPEVGVFLKIPSVSREILFNKDLDTHEVIRESLEDQAYGLGMTRCKVPDVVEQVRIQGEDVTSAVCQSESAGNNFIESRAIEVDRRNSGRNSSDGGKGGGSRRLECSWSSHCVE